MAESVCVCVLVNTPQKSTLFVKAGNLRRAHIHKIEFALEILSKERLEIV